MLFINNQMYIQTYIRWRHTLVSVEHPFFQPCSHPAAIKQQMVELDVAAVLAQLCLLGSNCVLTWREPEYYSNADKQIMVTSLASRWLCLSHVQMEFEDNKLACDAAMGWMRCLVCLSTCLSTCFYPRQLLVCFLIHQPVCFCIVADVSVQQKKNTLFKWIIMSIHWLQHCAVDCLLMPNTAPGDRNTY